MAYIQKDGVGSRCTSVDVIRHFAKVGGKGSNPFAPLQFLNDLHVLAKAQAAPALARFRTSMCGTWRVMSALGTHGCEVLSTIGCMAAMIARWQRL